MLRVARQRIAENPEMYVDHIYGEKEAGGTSVLFLSPVPFEQLGFPGNLPNSPLPNLTWEVLSKIPNFSIAAAVLFYGMWWIIDRRIELDKGNGNSTNVVGNEKGDKR
jgi:formate dehydrogenase iron-sulfur subunit